MSKYDALWAYVAESEGERLHLTFAQIGQIAGTAIDHSFLRWKKELSVYGWEVEKISLKAQTVDFRRSFEGK